MVLPQDQLSLIRRSSQRMLVGRLATVEGLRDMPHDVAAEVAGLSEDELRQRATPDEWSIKEVCGHLRDVGEIGEMRIYMIFTQSLPKLPPVNSAWVREHDYQEERIEDILKTYVDARVQTIDRLENLADANWARTGYHPEDGHMSIRQLSERLLAHEREHLEQLKAAKAHIADS